MPTDRYLALARVPGALRFFYASAVGRLGVAMSGFGLLWTVREATGSFAAAGAVVAAFSVAEAVGAPHLAREMDRRGQPLVLAASVFVHAAATAGLLVATVLGGALPLSCALAAVAGASLPRIGAASAVRWTHVLPDRTLLPAAFSLEAVGNDIAFLAGPTLVVAIAGVTEPVLGSIVAVTLTAGGAVGLAVQRASAPAPVTRTDAGRRGRDMRSRVFGAVLGVNMALGAVFGSLQVSVAAAAAEYRVAPLGGALYSAMSAASLVSGLVFGARRWSWPPQRVLLATASAMVAAVGLLQVADGVARLTGVLALVGAGVAPLLVLSALLTERCVPASELTRALAWSASTSSAGLAAAAGLAGIAVESGGAARGFLVTLTAAGLLVLAALAAEPARVVNRTHD